MNEKGTEQIRQAGLGLEEFYAKPLLKIARLMQEDPSDTGPILGRLNELEHQLRFYLDNLDGLPKLLDGRWREEPPPRL